MALLLLGSCKATARLAARYWTRKQISTFITRCEENAAPILGQERSKQICDCAVDKVADTYRDYKEAERLPAVKLLQLAQDCR